MNALLRLAMLSLSLWSLCSGTQAQSLRDPTLAPAEAGIVSATPGEKIASPASTGMTIIVRNGRPFLASGTRLYARGQKLGQARIDRISETEVWLREGGVLRKVPLFTGIQRRVALPPKRLPSVPCTDVQSNCPTP